MSSFKRSATTETGEREWREVVAEVEQARKEYARDAEPDDEDGKAVGRRWLRLWRAERRRDELMRAAD